MLPTPATAVERSGESRLHDGEDAVPDLRQQLAPRHLDEVALQLIADLHQGDVGEARVPPLRQRLDDLPDVRATRDGLLDVLGPDELTGCGEPSGAGELRVDLPTATEPAELLVGDLD